MHIRALIVALALVAAWVGATDSGLSAPTKLGDAEGALDLLAGGQLPPSGFVRQEDIPLKVFLANRFGKVYARPETSVPHERFRGAEHS